MEHRKVLIPIEIEGFSVTEAAVTVSEKQPDLMYLDFILCHEGGNTNGDYFTRERLKAAEKTPIFKPIDVEHTYPCIGVIIASEYVEPPAPALAYIKCSGVVWRYFYPDKADDIAKNFSSGKLKVSMEFYFKECDFLVGDQTYTEAEARRLHIDSMRGLAYRGSPVFRRFKDGLFGGVGVVANPADREAVILSVASQTESLKNYHDLLHFWYENDIYTAMSAEEIVAEHQKVHDLMVKLDISVENH